MTGQTDLVGRHLIADLSGVSPDICRDATVLMDLMRESLIDGGFHILDQVEHRFATGGHGFTGMFLLSESHAAIHTYPEHGYLALDIFACGNADPRSVLDALIIVAQPEDVHIEERTRTPGMHAEYSPAQR